jgi:hypothetical protein
MCANHENGNDDDEEEKHEMIGLYFIRQLSQMPFCSTIFNAIRSRLFVLHRRLQVCSIEEPL